MLSLTIFLPLISFLFVAFCGRFFGKFGAAILTIGALSLSLVILCFTFTVQEQASYFPIFSWLSFGPFSIFFELLFDTTTFIMLIVVLSISLIVHIYTVDYLGQDPHLPRFLSYLSLFTFFMLILISAENFIQLFLGWEGVGLCSYLLISFWFTRIQAGKAALKAVFINKIGDIALLIALSLLYYLYGSFSFSVIFALIPYSTTILYTLPIFGAVNLLNLIGFFLVIGVIGKSAQIGLHVWLPDAMEGPTPVSALLHAATMVTAGIFLVIRCSFLFDHIPVILTFCLIIGSFTAFFAATVGLFQNDIKRIIAFSTCSQLGYMLAACGSSQYNVALFHLFNHAFFKALLFLAAGSVIHALQDEQDIRKMGALVNFLPLTFTFFFIASFSLMGLPYLSGFFSKDLIIEQLLTLNHSTHFFFVSLLLLAAFCTAAYSFRLLYYVFFTRPNFSFFLLSSIKEAATLVQIPLIILTLLSIFSGWFAADFFVGIGTTAFSHSLTPVFSKATLIDHEFLFPLTKQLPFFFTMTGWFLAYYILTKKTFFYYSSFYYYYTALFFNQKWFFDKFYNTLSLHFLKNCFYSFYSFLDKGIIEFFGPTGFYAFCYYNSSYMRKYQSGNFSLYFFYIFSFFIFCLLCSLVIL